MGDSIKVPTDAESVSLLPAAEDPDEVTVLGETDEERRTLW